MIDLSKLTPSDAVRFWGKVIRSGEDGRQGPCWGWRGSHKLKGYARFYFQGHNVAAHRVAYHLTYGATDPHLEIDHLCRSRDCVNPHHLEAICPKLNRQRRIEHHRKNA